MADVDDIAARLESISEELADLALDALREAVDRGDTGRPDRERTLSRARASVDRAAAILRGSPDL